MKKLYLTCLLMTSLVTLSTAQYVDNALLFSQQNYGSTARSRAMGNAFGALGGDFGSLSINPAGIAIYQRSEASATISLMNNNQSESTYQGNSFKDSNNNFNFKNLGFVSVIPANDPNSGLVSLNFAIGYNRLANFNQNLIVGTPASAYSRMDAFSQNTNGIPYQQLTTTSAYDPYSSNVPWESKMAWETYLIDVANTAGDQYNTFLFQDEKVRQTMSYNREGYLNEYVATFGANLNHNLYLGATVGMQDLFLDMGTTYGESGDWGNFDYTSYNRSTGVGYNLKLGAIYRPVPALRLGLAFHTPTYFHIKETYNSTMNSNLAGISAEANGPHAESTPIGHFSYDFHSPLRLIASAAYQFGKKAFISADYELVSYAGTRFSNGLGGDDFSADNKGIKAVYQNVGNLRIGAEYRMTQALSLRGGMEMLGNPYQSNAYGVSQPNANFKSSSYSGGLGYRTGNLSFDLAFSSNDMTNYYYMYQLDGVNVDPVKRHSIVNELLLTVAIKL
ncbi:MAG: outer membrane protein transport protein [Marinilabiliales bacterium]|nr:outer membrane protein transport protein [Marinilabiliales bacterium]